MECHTIPTTIRLVRSGWLMHVDTASLETNSFSLTVGLWQLVTISHRHLMVIAAPCGT